LNLWRFSDLVKRPPPPPRKLAFKFLETKDLFF